MGKKLELMGEAAAEAVNAGDMDLAMFTIAVGAVSVLADVVTELRGIKDVLETVAVSGLGGGGE